jgi:glutamate transport system permease protein
MIPGLFDEMGPVARRRRRIITGIAAVIFAILLVLVLMRLAAKGQLVASNWSVLGRSDLLLLLLGGLGATMGVAAVAALIAVILGAVIASARLSRWPLLRGVARVVTEILRGLPPLMLIFFIFLGGPAVGLDISTYWALVIGVALFNAAVIGEIFRAGILALPTGQREGALSIGLSNSQTMTSVLLPQAVRNMLPALISQLVVIIKETSLGFIIGFAELSRDGRTAVEFLGEQYSLPVYVALAVVYIAVGLVLSRVANWLSKRSAQKYARADALRFE